MNQCYHKLAKPMKKKLGEHYPYFFKLANGMVAWTEAWGRAQHQKETKLKHHTWKGDEVKKRHC